MQEEKQRPGLVKMEEEKRKAMKLRKRMKKKVRKYKHKLKEKENNNEKKISNKKEGIPLIADQMEMEQKSNNNIVESEQTTQILQDQTEIEYSAPTIDLSFLNHCGEKTIQQFTKVLDRFSINGADSTKNNKTNLEEEENKPSPSVLITADTALYETNKTISKKKLKKANRFTMEELRELALQPRVVEPWDISATEPLLLIDLKSYRNTVQVPGHWRCPEKFLFSYYSELRPSYELPDFIKNTGIMESREKLKKQEMTKRSKTKKNQMRRPRLGKLDLEYEALYDAFFKYQTKPNLTIHGDLYEERKHISSKFNIKTYGELSDKLKEALGMTSPLMPPPWLYQMQRYGPPPGYKHIKIPGLNSSIPEGAKWGYQNHGWGKVPVDEFNRPLYGDIVNNSNQMNEGPEMIHIDRQLWGEIECQESDDENDKECEYNTTPIDTSNLLQESTNNANNDDHIITKPINIDVQEELNRSKKQKRTHTRHYHEEQPKLYEIIPSKNSDNIAGFFGSQYHYDIDKLQADNNNSNNSTLPNKDIKIKNTGYLWNATNDDVIVSLDPNDLSDEYGLNKNVIRNEYQNAQKERLPAGVGEKELTNMYMDYAKRQAMKLRQKDEKKKVFKF
ncbi:hypothetical protein BJ944DRAFT_240499 [Cunninghamella echinulata]|nr:hypothetical protein BJ944DRAFT_240499 [Cunninghamella echinulata]